LEHIVREDLKDSRRRVQTSLTCSTASI